MTPQFQNWRDDRRSRALRLFHQTPETPQRGFDMQRCIGAGGIDRACKHMIGQRPARIGGFPDTEAKPRCVHALTGKEVSAKSALTAVVPKNRLAVYGTPCEEIDVLRNEAKEA